MKYSVYIYNDGICIGRATLGTFNDYLRAAEFAQTIKQMADGADEPGNFTIRISASEKYIVAPAKEATK